MAQIENKYLYIACGLTIQSEIEFPELYFQDTESSTIDVTISIGKTPQKDSVIGFQKPISAYNKSEYWQEIPNIARYYAKNGNEVKIEPLCDNWNDIRLFFISNVLYSLLYQRNILPLLVGGIVDLNGNVILIGGKKLAGKSTLLFQLIQKGYSPFSDSCCTFLKIDKNIEVNPSLPTIYLWKDTFDRINGNQFEYSKLRSNINKVSINVLGKFSFQNRNSTTLIILNESKSNSEISIKKLNAKESFLELHELHLRPEWIEDMGKHIENFTLMSLLSNNLKIYKVGRPTNKALNSDLVNLIEETFLQNNDK